MVTAAEVLEAGVFWEYLNGRGDRAESSFSSQEKIVSLAVTATFVLADWIAKGLADGTFERIGGVIREVGTKHVITWLREPGSNASQLPTSTGSSPNLLNLIFSGANLVASGANAAISGKGLAEVNQHLGGIEQASLGNMAISGASLIGSVANAAIAQKGLANVNQRLGGIEQQVGNVEQHLQHAQRILQVASAASVLNLGVSVMGFAVVNQRLNELEKRLKQAEELLTKVDHKIDVGYYANFKAALGLAINAFTMNKRKNRESMAIQAINRFLEAQHIYTDYTDKELEQGSPIADEYLLTLSLAYVAEVRCHLELEEPDTALRRFQEGALVLRSRIQQYVELLLTSNPAVYLHPRYKDQIDLRRLTRIYQWIDPALDENAVFEMQRENLVKFVQEPNKWVDTLPSAIVERAEIKWGLFGGNPTPLSGRFEKEAYNRLPQVLEVVESMIETNRRFEAYQAEVQAIAQLGISFHDWLKLAPSSTKVQPEGAELMYIIPSKPLKV